MGVKMPWKEQTMVSEKSKFIALYQTEKFTMTELCSHVGISRVTGYAILKNFNEYGEDALEGLTRAHKSHPYSTPNEVIEDLLKLRKNHPRWGTRKLRCLLLDDWEEESVPSETTVNSILKKHGLVKPRKVRINRIAKINPYFDPETPNEIWSADFKGKFRMLNKQYCNPLTIADSKSRYLFAVEGLERAVTELVRPVFERVFKEFGLPQMIHTDNGSPFGCVNSLRRMTFLSVWFMELGITPVYSDPGCPTQNGRHERMHRDLKAEATRPPGRNLADQQRLFDQFVIDYNTIRPHEALDMRRPVSVHEKSPRNYAGIIYDCDYDRDFDVRMVSANGFVRWKSKYWMPVSTALSGKMIGIKEVLDGVWELYYRHVLLGYFNEKTGKTYEVEKFNL
ncbi:MAG: transposase [Bacteroidales bacterium]|nr:transposase [Bacteroidales bacterium]